MDLQVRPGTRAHKVLLDRRGRPGMQGPTGPAGPAPLIGLTPEPPGSQCAEGGQRIDVGVDLDGDGVLAPGEIAQTGYVCNGVSARPSNDSGAAAPDAGVDAAEDRPTAAGCSQPASDLPLPACECTGSRCQELIQFQPSQGVGYDDYPINGETLSNQYRSFARRELVMLVQYAAAFVSYRGATLSAGNGAPLGLGDMSERNGDIPGTSIGSPGHPPGVHQNGTAIDVAYYQLLPPDNHLRPVCPHTMGGADQYHCTEAPDNLDLQRTALFVGVLLTSPRVRVIGVDGRVGPPLAQAITGLCDAGVIASTACVSLTKLTYETADTGRGWFHFHHTHAHVSLND